MPEASHTGCMALLVALERGLPRQNLMLYTIAITQRKAMVLIFTTGGLLKRSLSITMYKEIMVGMTITSLGATGMIKVLLHQARAMVSGHHPKTQGMAMAHSPRIQALAIAMDPRSTIQGMDTKQVSYRGESLPRSTAIITNEMMKN